MKRSCSHAGSWYSASPSDLAAQLTKWLAHAAASLHLREQQALGRAKALIAPHAGYRYSGATAAKAYYQLQEVVRSRPELSRIVLLGPSHHLGLSCCALPSVKFYSTPFGDITIDAEAVQRLRTSAREQFGQDDLFETLSKRDDEEEHSLEMHLPYIHHIMQSCAPNRSWTLLPILVGHVGIGTSMCDDLGKLLAPFVDDPSTFVIASSDFCHWGKRFNFSPYDKSVGQIWESIQAMDKAGMQAIQSLNCQTFASYMKKHKNTICGRHPIGILMNAVSRSVHKDQVRLDFFAYAQSSRCLSAGDSSVSYAAGVLYQAATDLDGGLALTQALPLRVVAETADADDSDE